MEKIFNSHTLRNPFSRVFNHLRPPIQLASLTNEVFLAESSQKFVQDTGSRAMLVHSTLSLKLNLGPDSRTALTCHLS